MLRLGGKERSEFLRAASLTKEDAEDSDFENILKGKRGRHYKTIVQSFFCIAK